MRARRLAREFADTDERIGEAVAGRGARLRVSAAPLWMRAVVAPAALRFQTECPGVALTLRSARARHRHRVGPHRPVGGRDLDRERVVAHRERNGAARRAARHRGQTRPLADLHRRARIVRRRRQPGVGRAVRHPPPRSRPLSRSRRRGARRGTTARLTRQAGMIRDWAAVTGAWGVACNVRAGSGKRGHEEEGCRRARRWRGRHVETGGRGGGRGRVRVHC